MRASAISTVVTLFCAALPARAQIAVEESAGANVSKTTGEPTAVIFVGESPSDQITIYNISSQTDSYMVGTGVVTGGGTVMMSGGGHGQESQRLCETPCRLTIEPGTYSLRIGENLFLSERLNLNLSGGEVAYRVEEGFFPGFFLGTFLTVAGSLTAFTGALFLSDDDTSTAAPLLGGGGAAAVLGIILLATVAFGDADEIPFNVAAAQLR